MVAFYKHDIASWMDGTESLSDGAYRAYHVICQLIYLNEGPIALNEHGLAGRCRQSIRAFRKALSELVEAGKLELENGRISNARAKLELENVSRNRENAKLGGENSGKSRNPSAKSLKSNDTDEAPLQHDRSLIEKTREDLTPLAPQGGRARKSRLPDDWALTEQGRACAGAKNYSDSQIRMMAEAFANHHRSKGSLMLDWEAAWRTWIGNELKFGAKPIGATIKPGASGLPANVSEDVARDAYMRGSWPDSWGARPGFPGCRIPESIQREWLSLSPQQQERTA